MSDRRAVQVIFAVACVSLLAISGAVGYAIHDDKTHVTEHMMTAAPIHSRSENVRASDLGNAATGRQIFTRAGCVACHNYAGAGGKDGGPLDFMRGKLAVADVAAMSGRIWNHVPTMEKLFKAEKIPFPTFTGNQMADLMAYLHGGGPAPAARGSSGMMGG